MELSTAKYRGDTLIEKLKKKQTNIIRANTEAFTDIVGSL